MDTKQAPVYLIAGLGTDVAIFEAIDPNHQWKRIPWLLPATPDESLPAYARRMAEAIPAAETPILLGLSFGGVIAQEIAQIRKLRGVILVSSLMKTAEKPWWMDLFRHIPLYKLGVGDWRIKTLPLWAPGWGIHEPEEQALLQQMFARADNSLRFWSMRQLIDWQFTPLRCPFLRIHGERDGIFSLTSPETSILIKQGTHFMIWQQARLIRSHIEPWLNSLG